MYNLSVGTPDFPPAQEVMDAVVKAAQDPANYKYSLKDLPGLIRRGDRALSGGATGWSSCAGGDHVGLRLSGGDHPCGLHPLRYAGDVVLVPDPGYPIFGIGPSLAGAVLVTYPLTEENGYVPDLEALSEAADRAKFMIVSYPDEPDLQVRAGGLL